MTNEVIVERLNTLIDQNKQDHSAICKRLDFTNGKVKSLVIWRAVMIATGTVITSTVIPLLIYIAIDVRKDVDINKEIISEYVAIDSIDKVID